MYQIFSVGSPAAPAHGGQAVVARRQVTSWHALQLGTYIYKHIISLFNIIIYFSPI